MTSPAHWRARRARRRRGATPEDATALEGEVARRRLRPRAVRHALVRGRERTAVQLAARVGLRDRNRLTDLVFHARHPELGGRALRPREPMIREWRDIRAHVVEPALTPAADQPAAPAPAAPAPAAGSDAAGGAAPPAPAPFVPVPVEDPGGGRIRVKTDPAKSDVVDFKRAYGKTVPLHRLAAAALSALVSEARAAGLAEPLLLPTSGYRPGARQKQLFDAAVKRYGSANAAKKWVAPPGGSAHQSGRAIDLYLGGRNDSANVATLRKLPAYKWLAANAERFGFYPYEREPWHWEYNPPARPRQELSEPEAELSLFTGPLVLAKAIAAGERDEGKLTNAVYFARYPERVGQRIAPGDQAAKQEWLRIRDTMVRPALTGASRSAGPAAAGAPAPRKLGTLEALIPGEAPFRYTFTPDDALWTARFVRGEAGGRDDAENRAVIWSMLNRYALFTHPASHFGRRSGLPLWSTFGGFLRAYSTTLQPFLKSAGAVDRSKRYAREKPRKFTWVPLGGSFTDKRGRTVEKGQLAHHLRLQKLPWSAPEMAGSRALAEAVLSGRVPNPIGPASEFADTAAYYWQRHNRTPSPDAWRAFTHAHARGHKWTWVGDRPGLRQLGKNAFFIDNRVTVLAKRGPVTVRVIP